MIVANEKSWENDINKLSSEDKITEKDIADFRKTKAEQMQIIEKMNNNFFNGIETEKNKASFYRWLIIFEELAQKMGMSEKDIESAYLTKNKINWKRQQENY